MNNLIKAVIMFVVAFVCFYMAMVVRKKIDKLIQSQKTQASQSKPIEDLKNALLAHALVRVHNDKVEMLPISNYKHYDGDKLPSLSGCTDVNAFYSYIVPLEELKKGPFYVPMMEDKQNAITKFIEKHIKSQDDSLTFFEKYLEIMQTKEDDTEDLPPPIEVKEVSTEVGTVLETVPDTVPEAVPDTVPEAVPETVPEAVPDTVPEAVPETVPEAVPDTVPEAVPETVPEKTDVLDTHKSDVVDIIDEICEPESSASTIDKK
jgi:hypothetical protein